MLVSFGEKTAVCSLTQIIRPANLTLFFCKLYLAGKTNMAASHVILNSFFARVSSSESKTNMAVSHVI